VCTSSSELVASRDRQVDAHYEVTSRLAALLDHTREMVTCFKKISVIHDSDGIDTLPLIPSITVQVMTLERSAKLILLVLRCVMSS